MFQTRTSIAPIQSRNTYLKCPKHESPRNNGHTLCPSNDHTLSSNNEYNEYTAHFRVEASKVLPLTTVNFYTLTNRHRGPPYQMPHSPENPSLSKHFLPTITKKSNQSLPSPLMNIPSSVSPAPPQTPPHILFSAVPPHPTPPPLIRFRPLSLRCC